jgi:hypothetical protein
VKPAIATMAGFCLLPSGRLFRGIAAVGTSLGEQVSAGGGAAPEVRRVEGHGCPGQPLRPSGYVRSEAGVSPPGAEATPGPGGWMGSSGQSQPPAREIEECIDFLWWLKQRARLEREGLSADSLEVGQVADDLLRRTGSWFGLWLE